MRSTRCRKAPDTGTSPLTQPKRRPGSSRPDGAAGTRPDRRELVLTSQPPRPLRTPWPGSARPRPAPHIRPGRLFAMGPQHADRVAAKDLTLSSSRGSLSPGLRRPESYPPQVSPCWPWEPSRQTQNRPIGPYRQISTWPPQRRHVAFIRAGCDGKLMNSPDGPLESVMIRARPAIVSKGLSNSSSLRSQHLPRAPARSSRRRQAGTRPHVVPAGSRASKSRGSSPAWPSTWP
jgi:hypothetical protein